MVPLKITAELREQILAQFREKLENVKDGETVIKIEQKLSVKTDSRPKVYFTEKAFMKTLKLLMDYSTEIAWHGIVEREDDMTFRITDVLVYPQVVSGATVKTDDKEYADWLDDQPDEIFEKIRFQAHSHVRMGVSPSATDLGSQDDIVKQLTGEDYYIFAIFNKDLLVNMWIYDMKNNAKYDTDDIDIFLCNPEICQELADMEAVCKTVVTDSAKAWKAASTAKKDEKPKAPKAKKEKKDDKKKRAEVSCYKTNGEKVSFYKTDDEDEDDDTWSAYADGYYTQKTPGNNVPSYLYGNYSGSYYNYDY